MEINCYLYGINIDVSEIYNQLRNLRMDLNMLTEKEFKCLPLDYHGLIERYIYELILPAYKDIKLSELKNNQGENPTVLENNNDSVEHKLSKLKDLKSMLI